MTWSTKPRTPSSPCIGRKSRIRTGAAADAHYIADLVVRGLAQASDAKRVSSLLDILDRLVGLGGYGVDRAIESADRA